MPTDLSPRLLIATLLLAGCATAPPQAAPVPAGSAAAPQLAAAPESAPAAAPAAAAPLPAPAPLPPAPAAAAAPADAVLAYADRLRALPPAEQALEVQRLGEGAYTPLRATQLAVLLAQTRQPGQLVRAQALLQQVLADGGAAPLHPLARLLAAQVAEQRRAEEQAERQAQQLRDAQRRIDQLNERLEAVRTIERSLRAAPRPTP